MKNASNFRTLQLKLSLTLMLLLSFCSWSQNNDELVDCDLGAYYQTIRLQNPQPGIGSQNDFILFRVNPINGQFNFIANLSVSDGPGDLAVPQSVNVNSLGVNPIDRHFYFINARSPYQLYRMNASGNVSYLGNITGDISGNNQAGVFDINGNYYVSGSSKKVFRVDLNSLNSDLIMDVDFVASDLAINPDNGLFYGFDQVRRQLNTIDISTTTANVVGPAPNTSDYSIFGALYFLPNGQLIGYGDNTTIGPQGNSQESLVSFNLTTGAITPITTSYTVSTNDGASCPFTISIDKAASVSAISTGDSVTYTFTIFNRTTRQINDLVFRDELPQGLTFTSDPYDITGGMIINGSSNQQQIADFSISNLSAGISSFKLDVLINCDFLENEVSNQAIIGLNNFDEPVFSNDPATAAVNDPTVVSVNQPELEVPTEIVLEGCEPGDINQGNAVFDFSPNISENIISTFDLNSEYNYSPQDLVSIVYTDVILDTSCPLVVQRNFTATDNCGNTVSASQIIRIQDLTPPVPQEIPTEITLSCEELDGTGDVNPFCSRNIVTQPYNGGGNSARITFISKIIEENGDLVGYKFRIRNEQDVPITNVVVRVGSTVLFEIPQLSANTELFFNYGSAIAGVSLFWDGGQHGTASTNENDPTVVCDGASGTPEYTAIDNCNGLISGVPTDRIVNGDCPNEYTIFRTWSFTDACGNSSAVEQIITVIDDKAPVIDGIPPIISLECNEEIELSYTALDNCDGEIIGVSEDVIVPGDCENDFVINRTWTFQDSCGNASRFDQTIVIKDETAPEFNEELPADISVECNDIPDPIQLTATDNCGEATVDFSEVIEEGDCPNNYVIVRTWTATDLCDNTTIHTQNITVQDTEAPVLEEEIPSIITLECNEDIELSYVAIDNCDGEIVGEFEDTIVPGECDNDYVISRIWSFVDACGNASRYEQTIAIKDETAPEFVGDLPVDISVECDAIPEAEELTATDNCGEVTVIFEESSQAGSCEGEEIITRQWTATDACGNSVEHTQVISVQDTTPPVFESIDDESCRNLITNGLFESNEFDQGFQQLPQDQVEGWSTTADHGTIEIQRSGQINGVVSYSGNYHFELNGRNLDDLYQNFETVPGSTLTIKFYHKKRPGSSQTDDMRLFMGSNLSELVTIADYSVSAEEDWKENTLIYTVPEGQTTTVILFQALSGSTNSIGNLIDEITIVSDSDEGQVCFPEDLSVECDEIPEPLELTATDNCGEASISFSEEQIEGSCDNSFTLVRTWTASDSCGNTTTLVQNIEVIDATAPEFVEALPGDLDVECEDIPEAEVLTATDNCGEAQVSFEEEIITEDLEGNDLQEECTYRAYYVRSENGSQFYKFVVENGAANLELLTTRNYSAHLAYDGENNIIYGLLSSGQSVERIDPATGNSLGFIQLDEGLSSINSGAYYNGKLYLGSSNQDRIVEVDPATGSYTTIASDVPVNGADLEFRNGQLYLATRSGHDLYLIENGQASLIGSIPTNVSGMALTEDGNFYLSYNGSTSFEIIDENAQSVGSLPVFFNGEPFNLDNGDMASGCGTDSPPNIGECTEYSILRTWTATDACGNTTVHTQTINVSDTTAPEFQDDLPEDVTVECSELTDAEVITAIDNCSEAIVSFNEVSTPGSCAGEFLLERTWIATDACGNTASHTQIVTVIDTTAPEIVGEFEELIEVECNAIPEVPELQFEDACADVMDVTFTEENNQMPDFEDYQIIRTWTVTDTCGNEAVFTQTINVSNDSTAGAFDSRVCNTEGPYDLFSFLTGDYQGTGEWVVVQGDASLLVGSTFNTSSIEEDTQYIFNYTELGGSCSINTNLGIFVENCEVLSCGAEDVEISKAVTANSDGFNDFFTVGGIEDCGFVIEVEIYNRWGSRVYKSTDYQNDWNGQNIGSTVGGSDTVPTGTYYYVVNLRNSGLDPFAGPVYVATNK